MQRILTVFFFLLISLVVQAQNTNPEAAAIKKQMAAIRQKTNWSDPAEAKVANAEIEELAAKLTLAIRNKNGSQQQTTAGNETTSGSENEGGGENTSAGENTAGNNTKTDAEKKNDIQQKIDDFGNKLWNQMMAIIREGGTWDMAKPLREEIVEEYKEDENPTVKCKECIQSMPFLLINMSMPQAQVIIDQMPVFRGIKTLVITADTKGTAVNLDEILRNAKEYPLEELYIINFGESVSDLPASIGDFSGLTTLNILNNSISGLPASVAKLANLRTLHTDINPIHSLLPIVNSLKNLKQLGVAKTAISETEISQIHQALPNCEILK
jgi:hypothetical protein